MEKQRISFPERARERVRSYKEKGVLALGAFSITLASCIGGGDSNGEARATFTPSPNPSSTRIIEGDPTGTAEPSVTLIPTETAVPAATAAPTETSTPTPEPTATAEPTPDLAATREERIRAFANEVGFDPGRIPESLVFTEAEESSTMIDPFVRDDIQVYSSINAFNYFNELVSKESERFERDNILLANTISLTFLLAENQPYDPDNTFDFLFSSIAFNGNEEELAEAELNYFTRRGASVDVQDAQIWEKILNNPDGTKTSYWIMIRLRKERDSSSDEVTERYVGEMGATKLYPENPLFDQNTAFDREPQGN